MIHFNIEDAISSSFKVERQWESVNLAVLAAEKIYWVLRTADIE
jgi:hypothetical protein